MTLFNVPSWARKHEYPNKKFSDLHTSELEDLKKRLSRFRPAKPDISIVIPAWNEGDQIFRTLSSLADTTSNKAIEIIVINNNSTDHTQEVLDLLGVLNYFQPLQGIAHARQLGLEMAKGEYHLCADADTLYPPDWCALMIKPMQENKEIVGVYGRYSFVVLNKSDKLLMWCYERLTGLLVRLRKFKREYINVLGFSMGFVTEVARRTGGFNVTQVRQLDNSPRNSSFVDESEDGRMAINLKTAGRLKLVSCRKARVFTSYRRLESEGGTWHSLINRTRLHTGRLYEYLTGK